MRCPDLYFMPYPELINILSHTLSSKYTNKSFEEKGETEEGKIKATKKRRNRRGKYVIFILTILPHDFLYFSGFPSLSEQEDYFSRALIKWLYSMSQRILHNFEEKMVVSASIEKLNWFIHGHASSQIGPGFYCTAQHNSAAFFLSDLIFAFPQKSLWDIFQPLTSIR